MKDAILLILGAIAGLAAQLTYASAKTKIAGHRTAAQRRKSTHLDSSTKHSKNILSIYRSAGLEEQLYTTRSFSNRKLPILHDTGSQFVRDVRYPQDNLIKLSSLDVKKFPVDQRLIDRKMARGAILWDGPATYITGVESAPTGELILTAGICNYFGYVSLAQQISTEANSTKGKKSILLGNYRRFSDAISGTNGPVTLSATVTCVFESRIEGRVVALQRRSDVVVNAAGMYGVMPILGLESNQAESAKSRYGMTYYNFLKEFIEEFFGLEPVIRAATNLRADMDWIFQLPNAPELIDQLEDGNISLSCTGLGIDLSDGSSTIALLAHFTSPEYLDVLRSTAVGSWESKASTATQPAVEFISIDSPRLEKLATIEHMDPSSIFSLDLARERLNNRQ